MKASIIVLCVMIGGCKSRRVAREIDACAIVQGRATGAAQAFRNPPSGIPFDDLAERVARDGDLFKACAGAFDFQRFADCRAREDRVCLALMAEETAMMIRPSR